MAHTEQDKTVGTWIRGAGRRLAVHWVAKMVGTTMAMSAFFVVYFWLLRHARGPVTTVPRIWIDRAVPFQPGALPLYVSLWVYVCLAPSLLVSRRALAAYAAAATALSMAGFAVFILWPTSVPPPETDPSLAPSIAYLKVIDASGNAFPSLHVAFAVFSALWLGRLLRETGAAGGVRALNWLWCAGIVYSTLAIRQHVALDALAGAALGAAVAAAHLRIMRGGGPAGGPTPP
jgi:membrane-associated phospholipid phosphatase